MQASRHLSRWALEEADSWPCFWTTRGLVPKAWIEELAIPPPVDGRIWSSGSLGGAGRPSGIVYSDGSGGGKRDPRIKRCAWGIVHFNNDDEAREGAHQGWAGGGVPGKQTSGRAELWAACHAMRVCGDVEVRTDYATVVNRVIKGRQRDFDSSTMGDIWEEFWKIKADRDERGLTTRFTKVKGHPTAEDIENGNVQEQDAMGNEMADGIAGAIADNLQLGMRFTSRLDDIDNRTKLVQERIIEIELRCAEARKDQEQEETPEKPTREQRQEMRAERRRQAVEAAGHELQLRAGGGWRCGICRQGASKKDFSAWIRRGRCTGVIKDGSIKQVTRLGRGTLHTSHRLSYKRGVVWCRTCGAWGTQAPRGLTKPCKGHAESVGRAVLKRLATGKTPKAGVQWPLDG